MISELDKVCQDGYLVVIFYNLNNAFIHVTIQIVTILTSIMKQEYKTILL